MVDSDSEEGTIKKINSYDVSVRRFNDNNIRNAKNNMNKKRVFFDKKNK